MNILESLAHAVEGGLGGTARNAASGEAGGIGSSLGEMLQSGKMGNIAATLLSNKKGGVSWLKGALLAGAGAMLWSKLTEQMNQANAANPKYSKTQTALGVGGAKTMDTPDQQAARLIRAFVYAARADGHIDGVEAEKIKQQIESMHLGQSAAAMLRAALNEAVDPSRIAVGIDDAKEALQLYAVSAVMVDPNEYAEKAYLDALAQSLNIPNNVRDQINNQVLTSRQQSGVGTY